MNRIAIIITCHNRRDKTIACLKYLYNAYNISISNFSLTIYLTDDGSTDGTSEMVKSYFPSVNLIQGNGTLYWAGGMRLAWANALKYEYDYYLLINDDTLVFEDVFDEFVLMEKYSKLKYKSDAVYVGFTCNSDRSQTTYGGYVFINKFFASIKRLIPNGNFQSCELANCNILLVPKGVINKIGIFDEKYIHGLADFDYSIMVTKSGFPLIASSRYLGICENDHRNIYSGFAELKLKERKRLAFSPNGLGFIDKLTFTVKHFPYRIPIQWIGLWLKIMFPRYYLALDYWRNKVSR